MKILSVIVIALALASVSNQQMLSFGDFVEGHMPPAASSKKSTAKSSAFSAHGKLRIKGGSDERFNRLVGFRRVILNPKSDSEFSLEGLCGITCTYTGNGVPPCATPPANCEANDKYVYEMASRIIFLQPIGSARLFWRLRGSTSGNFIFREPTRASGSGQTLTLINVQ